MMMFTKNTLIAFLGGILLFVAGQISMSFGLWHLIPCLTGWFLLINVEEKANDYLEIKEQE